MQQHRRPCHLFLHFLDLGFTRLLFFREFLRLLICVLQPTPRRFQPLVPFGKLLPKIFSTCAARQKQIQMLGRAALVLDALAPHAMSTTQLPKCIPGSACWQIPAVLLGLILIFGPGCRSIRNTSRSAVSEKLLRNLWQLSKICAA